ncbi:hypothetical protein [Salibacterium halotolerans]|uniref:Uncharacterized protein n=1 Tax=Salibacterium halotolerans TaxID=1884432 RepID=A0A1I5N6F3_9BACI|nr:hypothetical protein [Salibacterium halotolerans]SFP17459.1 hypothetical protein SAMN05518683_10317 [Salibacterium halotolerans]
MDQPHKMSRGDAPMTDKYQDQSMEYYDGNTKIKIVDPGPVPPEKVERILEQFHRVGWSIWKDLSLEEQKAINAEYDKQRAD